MYLGSIKITRSFLLQIRRAMQALIDHSLAAAPVWSSRLQCYTQLLTTGLCLRLLAQAFPLENDSTPVENPTSTDASGDDPVAKTNADPSVSMSYWEGKTTGSVLSMHLKQVLHSTKAP